MFKRERETERDRHRETENFPSGSGIWLLQPELGQVARASSSI